jgi:hypothetical protein
MRIAGNLFGSFADTKILTFRDEVHHALLNTSTSNQLPFITSGLDFSAGNLLICLGYGQRHNNGGPYGSTVVVSDGVMSGWNSIGSVFRSTGNVADYTRLRAMWKIADGSEGSSLSLFGFSGNAPPINMAAYQLLAFDILGGAATLTASPSFSAIRVGVDSSIATKTIHASGHSVPVLALSFASNTNTFAGNADDPSITFSQTPDESFAWDYEDEHPGSNAYVKAVTKLRLFQSPDTPVDVTASVGSNTQSLASFGMYLN